MVKNTLFPTLRGRRYEEALKLQEDFYSDNGFEKPFLGCLFHEPEPVFTAGKSFQDSDKDSLLGAPFLRVDRGGGITYHGPGQVVGFPLLDLKQIYGNSRAVRSLISDLAEVISLSLERYGIQAHFDERNPGLWVDDRKIASIGVSVREGRVFHGFSVNLKPLKAFQSIKPCGFDPKRVTSIQEEWKESGISCPSWEALSSKFAQDWQRVLGARI
jgi:lipoate-protein ligase B